MWSEWSAAILISRKIPGGDCVFDSQFVVVHERSSAFFSAMGALIRCCLAYNDSKAMFLGRCRCPSITRTWQQSSMHPAKPTK